MQEAAVSTWARPLALSLSEDWPAQLLIIHYSLLITAATRYASAMVG